jgi:thioredoxin reductase
LSYRRPAFSRIKQRNDERITTFTAEGRIDALFNSQVKSVQPGSAVLLVEEPGNVREIRIRADYVFVLIGGEPPYPLLKKIGIRFHGEREAQTQCAGDPKRDVSRLGALPAGETQKA